MLRVLRRAVIVPAGLMVCLGAGAEPARESSVAGYTFSLDGRSFAPRFLFLRGHPGRPVPGDLVRVGRVWLTLGPERDCHFTVSKDRTRVFVRRPDGSLRVVGAYQGWTRDEDGEYARRNGLSRLSKEELRGLWGVGIDDWTDENVLQVAQLDLDRVALDLGDRTQSADEPMPDLPSGLRRLMTASYTDFQSVAKLEHLELLEVTTVQPIDIRWLRAMQQLRVLRLRGGKLRNTQAFPQLPRLRQLDLSSCDGLEDLPFVDRVPRLEELDVSHTGVRDLAPAGRLSHVARIVADRTPASELPAGPLPALRELRVMSTHISDEAVAVFAGAHPGVRIWHRWNSALRRELAGMTRLRVRSGAMGVGDQITLYEEANALALRHFADMLEVVEEQSGFHCGCLGGPCFEIYRNGKMIASISLHHGQSLRWDGWPGDGLIRPVAATELVEWLAARGVTGPLDEVDDAKGRAAAYERATIRATAGMSDRLAAAFDEAFEEARTGGRVEARAFRDCLWEEYPKAAERIRLLLRSLGGDNGSWSGIEWQDQVALNLLAEHDVSDLAAASELALMGNDRRLRRGAARLWLSWDSPLESWEPARSLEARRVALDVLAESRAPTLRQRGLRRLMGWADELPAGEAASRVESGLLDPHAAVRRQAVVAAARLELTESEGLLLDLLEAKGVQPIALPAVPDEELADIPEGASRIGGLSSDVELAGLALGYLRSRRAFPTISYLFLSSRSQMLRVALALYGPCERLQPEDFRTKDNNQALQYAAVEVVVRCQGRHGLDWALDYDTAEAWYERPHVFEVLQRMLIDASAPGGTQIERAEDLNDLRSWYQAHGSEYLQRVRDRATSP